MSAATCISSHLQRLFQVACGICPTSAWEGGQLSLFFHDFFDVAARLLAPERLCISSKLVEQFVIVALDSVP